MEKSFNFNKLDNLILDNNLIQDKEISNEENLLDKVYDEYIIEKQNFSKDFFRARDSKLIEEKGFKGYPFFGWNHKLKLDSFFIGGILQHEAYFNSIGVSIVKVTSIFCCMYNFRNKIDYIKIPAKYIANRTRTSRTKVNGVLLKLSKIFPYHIKIKKLYGEYYISIDKEIIKIDPYLATKVKATKKMDLKILTEKFYKKDNAVYFDSYSKNTIYKHLKETILGISIAYTEMIYNYINSVEYREDRIIYGKRKDITYIEVPIHIICSLTNLPYREVIRYLNVLCNSCNYIKKHNVQYYNQNVEKQYFNETYVDDCDLRLYNQIDLDELKNHPVVTNYSYILFNQNLEGTKLIKKILTNQEKYKQLIINELKDYKELIRKTRQNNYVYDEEYFGLFDNEVEEIIKKHNNRKLKDEKDYIIENKDESGFNIINREKLNDLKEVRIRKSEKIFNIDFLKLDDEFITDESGIKIKNKNRKYIRKTQFECISLFKKLIGIISDETKTKMKEFKGYIKIFNTVKDYLESGYEFYRKSEMKLLKKYIKMIERYKLQGCFLETHYKYKMILERYAVHNI